MSNEPNGLFEFWVVPIECAEAAPDSLRREPRPGAANDLRLLLIGGWGRLLAKTDLINGCKADTQGARASGISPRERDSTICSREIPQWTESH